MSGRADVLGALLDGERLTEESPIEAAVKSQAHVAGVLGNERRHRAGQATPGDFNSKHPRGGKGSGSGGKFVKKGSSGTPVKEVQKRLGVAQTGSFAFDTQAAVRNFQRAHGLQVDGVVGAQTAQALLGNRNAKVVKPGALSAKDAAALKVPAGSSRKKKTPAVKPAPKKGRAPNRYGGGVVV